MFEYKVIATDGSARVGEFTTPHGTITTPVFMPVGTHGAVKSVSPRELESVGAQIILGNTYHLYLRPGDELIKSLGGLHQFMQWQGPILTDSGGFQVFSLGEKSISGKEKVPLRKVSEEGIMFRSHLDGSKHLFTPEKSIQVQTNLGADIIMAFDQPVYGMSDLSTAREAMERTHRWLERSRAEWSNQNKTGQQALFGIVQGGIYDELHQNSAEFVGNLDLPGNAIGGLSVGEGKPEMWQATKNICSILPESKPRYFMGLGDPQDLIEAVFRGVDMFDCVSPSRLARHGVIWRISGDSSLIQRFWEGNYASVLERVGSSIKFSSINLKNQTYRGCNECLVNPGLTSIPELEFPLSTLRHYLSENEMLGFRILTLHNLLFLIKITELIKYAIINKQLSRLVTNNARP